MAIRCDICANCSACHFAGLARSAFFDATTPCRCPLSPVGKPLFRAFSQKRGTLSRNTGSFRVFIAGSCARTYAHSAGFRFLPSLFVCYRLIFSTLWVKIVVFSLVHRFTTERVHCAGERKWSVGPLHPASPELRGTVARGEGKGEGEFQKSSPLLGWLTVVCNRWVKK